MENEWRAKDRGKKMKKKILLHNLRWDLILDNRNYILQHSSS